LKIKEHWLQGVTQLRSPNANDRPASAEINLLVVHNISLPPKQYGGGYIEDFFQNKLNPSDHPYFTEIADLKVSAHLLVNRKGELTQFVAFDRRAWHAGASCYQGQENCNDFSIGIELEGCDTEPYTEQQYRALVEVTRLLLHQYPKISPQRICGHSDIAPLRKTDPGPAFRWPYFHEKLAQ